MKKIIKKIPLKQGYKLNPQNSVEIEVKGIFLDSLAFNMKKNGKSNKNGLTVDIKFQSSKKFEKNALIYRFEFFLETEIFTINGAYTGIFETRPEFMENLKSFSELNAPTYIFPYILELISNITSRSIYSTLIIPPLNVKNKLCKNE